ncbi:MAG: hypothetical protein QGH51_01485 [Planctomycetota bacterium]|jgi:hypothetical protein|nr:hypothetical protein [Planctomycetota bacterium]MDP6940673.1 hypothetical protein [Planctomycetota bacterium]
MEKNDITLLGILFIAVIGGNALIDNAPESELEENAPAIESVKSEATRGGGKYGGRSGRDRAQKTKPLLQEGITFEEILVDEASVRGETHVHFGSLFEFDEKENPKVGEVDSRAIYLEIPAYQTIRKDKLKKGSARRAQLLGQATQVHAKAVLAVAQQNGYALVIEKGKGEELPKIPANYPKTDLTNSCIQVIKQ